MQLIDLILDEEVCLARKYRRYRMSWTLTKTTMQVWEMCGYTYKALPLGIGCILLPLGAVHTEPGSHAPDIQDVRAKVSTIVCLCCGPNEIRLRKAVSVRSYANLDSVVLGDRYLWQQRLMVKNILSQLEVSSERYFTAASQHLHLSSYPSRFLLFFWRDVTFPIMRLFHRLRSLKFTAEISTSTLTGPSQICAVLPAMTILVDVISIHHRRFSHRSCLITRYSFCTRLRIKRCARH